MTARPRLLLAVLLLTCLTLTVVDTRTGGALDPLRSATSAVLGPVERGTGRAAGAVGDAVAAVGDLADRTELQRLREDNARLRGELAAGAADRRVVEQWRALLGLTSARDWSVVPARVVGAGSALGFARTVTLDAGSRDGVAEGQPVLTGAGLVGRTVEVGPWTSTVLLLDDPQFGVGTRVAGTGALGLARGDGAGRLRLVQVDPGPVAGGETVVTSGSGTFVADLPVGRTGKGEPTAGGLTTTAEVTPFVDPGAVDLVAVVVELPRTVPRAPLEPSP